MKQIFLLKNTRGKHDCLCTSSTHYNLLRINILQCAFQGKVFIYWLKRHFTLLFFSLAAVPIIIKREKKNNIHFQVCQDANGKVNLISSFNFYFLGNFFKHPTRLAYFDVFN